MTIDSPAVNQIPQLRDLWQLAFGDEETFMDAFFQNGFSSDRCRCITADGRIAAALYWFETLCSNQNLAYLYGVATHPDFRGQGLCRTLMENTRRHLKALGYQGILLVPQDEPLRNMYRNMGYQDCTTVSEFFCTADPDPVPIYTIESQEYTDLRRMYLPPNSIIQEGNNLTFLESYAKFYKGTDFLLAAAHDGDSLFAMEYLGNRHAAPGVLRALGFSQGTFRTIGSETPFAMFCPLSENAAVPSYFAFAFD